MALSDKKLISSMMGGALPQVLVYPMAAATTIHQGGIVVLNTSGYAVPGDEDDLLLTVGVAEESVVNSGAAGAKNITVRRGVFPFVNKADDLLTQAEVGKTAWLVDDETVGKTKGGRAPAGRLVKIDSNGAWVEVGVHSAASLLDVPSDAARIQAGSATLVAGTVTINSGIRLTATSRIVVTPRTPGGGTQGVKYAVPQANRTTGAAGVAAFVINAVDNAGALVNTDTSTLDFIIVG